MKQVIFKHFLMYFIKSLIPFFSLYFVFLPYHRIHNFQLTASHSQVKSSSHTFHTLYTDHARVNFVGHDDIALSTLQTLQGLDGRVPYVCGLHVRLDICTSSTLNKLWPFLCATLSFIMVMFIYN